MKYFLGTLAVGIGVLIIPAGPAWAADCDVVATIDQLRSDLSSRSLFVGDTEYTYTEIRAGNAKKTRHDPEMEIVLVLLNLDTCATQTVTVVRRGATLIVPEGYEIEPIRRINGIQWNDWNTEYRVIKPAAWFLVGNLYPHIKDETTTKLLRAASGKMVRKSVTTRTVTNVFYTPFTSELRTPGFITGAHVYQRDLSNRTDAYLRERGVYSRAYPEFPAPDVPELPVEYAERIMPIEHMDLTEFTLDPEYATDRVHVLIAANRDRFATLNCSPVKACGPRQWTKKTWQGIDKAYPTANLPNDYLIGARDPFWSMIATRLLHDENLRYLKITLTQKEYTTLTADPRILEEAVDAMYNTDPRRVVATLKGYLAHPERYPDWIQAKGRGLKGKLVAETKGYITKLRYLRDQWPGRTLVTASTQSPN